MGFSLHLTAFETENLPALFRDWRQDTLGFLHHSLPKLIVIVAGAFVLMRVWRAIVHRIASLQEKKLPPGLRAQQVRTVASVITSVGVFIVLFGAILQALPLFNLDLRPLLASAGIAGLAIGFGAQTLVKDFINGFFILLENQYDIGDSVRIAGVKGVVEAISLRHTTLRDDDGTVHTVPNSQITIVSNMTRDWSQLALKVVVAYSEPSERIVKLLQEVGEEVRHDPNFADDIVGEIQVPGIDRVGNGEAEYLMLVKTRPNKQYAVSRELRRRIKECFHQQNVQTAGPGKVYVMDQGVQAS
ncbi:MAG: mechanosensitive ion channel family protein [Acidobacteria bacterium]|nr:MAG: mechanosensitive ion channel family protein [Acidobacteriota bacterium]